MCNNHGNRGVVYKGPDEVAVENIPYPELAIGNRKCDHGVILKVVTTNICGSDQHMVRGRTTAPSGLVLGHEITGLVVETGRDVEFIKQGDLVSVPFNIACGRCRNCKEGRTGICLNVNPARPGAACVIVGDMNAERLTQAQSFGCETIDLTEEGDMADKLEVILGEREVDAFVDCVGIEAHACGCNHGKEAPATVLNSAMQMTRAGGQIGIPGLYVTEDPGAVDDAAKVGALSMRFGLGQAKSHSFHTGQCPVMKYHRPLMQAILFEKVKIADAVNVEVISLDDAPDGYAEFDGGAAKKYVIDPHGVVA